MGCGVCHCEAENYGFVVAAVVLIKDESAYENGVTIFPNWQVRRKSKFVVFMSVF